MTRQKTFELRQWSTPLIIGAYLVTGVSGVMLFFHFGESLIKDAHEWIGMLFVLGALLHIKNHWTPFKRYFSKPIAQAVMVSALAAGLSFMVVSGDEPAGNPVRAVMHSIEQAPLSQVAQLQKRDLNELVQSMQSAGFTVTDPDQTLQMIADANGQSPRKIIPLLFQQ